MNKKIIFISLIVCPIVGVFLVAYSCANSSVEINQPIHEFQTSVGAIWHILFTEKQDCVLVSGFNGKTLNSTVALYDVKTGNLLHEFLKLNGAQATQDIGFSKQEDKVYALRGTKMIRWDIESGTQVTHSFRECPFRVASPIEFSAITHVVYNAEKKRHTIEFYDVDTFELRYQIAPDIPIWRILAFSPDARQFLISTGNPEDKVYLIDTLTAKVLTSLKNCEAEPLKAAFSPDGARILTHSEKTKRILYLWNRDTGKLIRDYESSADEVGYSFVFSPDGKRILWAGKPTVLLDAETGTVLRSLGKYLTIAGQSVFSRDGKFAVTAHVDGFIRLWDLNQ